MSISSWNVPPPTYDAHSATTSLTPYLQLPHLLSLTWLAYPILSLIFVAFRLQLSLASAQDAVVSAKEQLLTSCKAAEDAATSTASMPRYMALATNKQYADAVNASMDVARAALVLSLTAMEAIINFIIDLYRSTLLCFLEFVVRGGLSILIGAVQEVNNLLSSATSSLRTSIQSDIASANNIIKSAIDAINKVNPFGDISVPQINIPSLDALQNVTLPASFEDALTKLNASLPSVSDIKNTVEDVIDTPFELLKKDINDTFAGISFEPEGLPVPEISRLSFCNQLDPSVIDDVGHDLIKAAKIGVVVLILLALLLIALNCLLTWYKWRCMKQHLEYTRQAWLVDPTMVHATSESISAPQIIMSDHNLMTLHANSQHPLITKITNQLSARLRLTPSQHTHTQWFFHYIFHAPALACFLIGFFGLMSIQIQLLVIGPLVAKYQARTTSTISDFSTTIATSINQSMYNQSSLYVNQVNLRVDEIQSTINDGVFGWVNGTTTTLNSTINTFYTDIQNAVTTVFGGTILESPANAFLKCFIGSKVDAIENALTFLHDNLHVNIPRMNQTVLILSPESINEASQPIAAAAIGGGGDDNDGLIMRLVNSYAAALRKERIMFAIFLALWGVVVLMGLCIVFWHSFGRSYFEKRGRRKWEAEQRTGLENIRAFNGPGGDVKTTNKEFRSFSPLPSPKGSAFRPFWSSRSNSPFGMNNNTSPSSSVESVTQPNYNQTELDEATYSQPREAPAPVVVVEKKKTGKLLAIGRRAMSRGGERLKKDGTEEELSVPLPISEPVGEHRRNTAWYGKMATLLARKEPALAETESVDFWDENAMVENVQNRPKLQIYTQRGLDKYGPPPRQSELLQHPPQSRWSASPGPTQTTWMSIMSPTKKAPPVPAPTPAVIITQEPNTPTYPHPPIGIPIQSRPIQNANVPLDVGLAYDDDPFMSPPPNSNPAPPAIVLPMPLYNGFDSPQNPHSYPSPPRHPQLQARFSQRRRQEDASPPPPLKSPRMFTPQLALAPPPANDRQTRSTSWRVTNAAPGDTASLTSSTSPGDAEEATTPVTRLLTTTHARRSSSVNPFITPFDDEHRVQIDHPSGEATRKSMATNPFTAHAM